MVNSKFIYPLLFFCIVIYPKALAFNANKTNGSCTQHISELFNTKVDDLTNVEDASDNTTSTDYKTLLLNASPLILDLIKEIASYYKYLQDDLGVDFKDRYYGRIEEIIKVLLMQSKLEKELLTDANWIKGMANRSPLKGITITQKELIGETSYKIPVEAFQDFTKMLKNELKVHFFKTIYNNTDIKPILHDEVSKLVVPLIKFYSTNIRTERIIGGLMRVLPPDKKQLPIDRLARLAFLQENLPKAGNTWSKFNPSLAGLPKKEEIYTSSDIIKILENANQHEEMGRKLEKVFLLYHYLEGRSGHTPITLIQAKNYITSLNEENFRQVFDIDHIATTLKQLAKEAKLEEIAITDERISKKKTSPIEIIISKYITPKINNILSKQIKIIKTANGNETYFNPEKIILKEVPPYIAITRGFIGGDCSTNYSWLYPNNYTDRVFYIYKDTKTSDGKFPIGYAAGIYIEVDMGITEAPDKKRVFFLHTINGVNVGNLRASMILDALITNPELVGAERIAVSTDGGYIDTAEIEAAFNSIVKNNGIGKGIDIEFYDGWDINENNEIGSRRKIEELAVTPDYININTYNYDTMDMYKKNYTVLSPNKSFTDSKVFNLPHINSILKKYNNDLKPHDTIWDTVFTGVILNSDIIFTKENLVFLKNETNYDFFMEKLSEYIHYNDDSKIKKVSDILEVVKNAKLLRHLPTKLLLYSTINLAKENLIFLKDKTKYAKFMINLSKVIFHQPSYVQRITKILETLRNADLLRYIPIMLLVYSDIIPTEEELMFLSNEKRYDRFIKELSKYSTSFVYDSPNKDARITKILEILRNTGLLKNIPFILVMKSNIIPTKAELAFLKDNIRYDQFMEELSKYAKEHPYSGSTRYTQILEAIRNANLLKEIPTRLLVRSTIILTKEELAFLDNKKYDQFMKELLLHEYRDNIERITSILEMLRNTRLLKDIPAKLLLYSTLIPTKKELEFLKDNMKYDQFMKDLSSYSTSDNIKRITQILEILRSASLLKDIPAKVFLNSTITIRNENIIFLEEQIKYDYFMDELANSMCILQDKDISRVTQILKALRNARLLKDIPAQLLVFSTILPTKEDLMFLKNASKYDNFMDELLEYAPFHNDRITQILEAIRSSNLLKDVPAELLVYSTITIRKQDLDFLKDKVKYDQFMKELYVGDNNYIKRITEILNILKKANLLKDIPANVLLNSNIILTKEDLIFLEDKTKYDKFMDDLVYYSYTRKEQLANIFKALRRFQLLKDIPAKLLAYLNIIPSKKDFAFLHDKVEYDHFMKDLTENYTFIFTDILEALRDYGLLKDTPAKLFVYSTIIPKLENFTYLKNKMKYNQFMEELYDCTHGGNFQRTVTILEFLRNNNLLKSIPKKLKDLLVKLKE